MKLKNALSKLAKHTENIHIHCHDDGRPYKASAQINDRVISFHANGPWVDDTSIICINIRHKNDHDDLMTDYYAGASVDTLGKAIRLAEGEII